MFGDSAIKRNKRVRLIIHLVRLEEALIPAESRLNGSRIERRILDVHIPTINLPIAPAVIWPSWSNVRYVTISSGWVVITPIRI